MFVHCFEYFLQKFNYQASSSFLTYEIIITGEKSKVYAATAKLISLHSEIIELSKPGIRLVGKNFIDANSKGSLNNRFLSYALKFNNFSSEIKNSSLYTDAPVYKIIELNDMLYHKFKNLPTYRSKEIRQLFALVQLKKKFTFESLLSFSLINDIVIKKEDKYSIKGKLDEAYHYIVKNIKEESYLEEGVVEENPYFEGGTIVFHNKKGKKQ